MKHLLYVICLDVLLVVPAQLFAEQEVTLKSGASFIGDVTLDGDAIIVQVDEAKLRVPLADVAAISPLDAGHQQQAQRLLMTALESKLMNNAGREVLAILGEAARLDPDDPKIAYWYASTLVEAGFGKAASEVYERRREEIGNAYPGMSDQLAARIAQRLELEKMPAAVVARIDKLNSAAAQQSLIPEVRPMAAVFRLVDQNERPIERSAFRIQSNAQDDNLESFHDGYYLFTFNQNRHNRDEPCRLEITQPGLEPKTFQFRGGSPGVEMAGEFVVARYDETARKPFRARIVARDGVPVAGATITLSPVSDGGSAASDAISGDTDDDGRIEVLVFPMKYSYRVQAEGFNHHSGTVDVQATDSTAASSREQQFKLDRAIRATVRVAWMSTSFQGGKTSGEDTLKIAGEAPAPNRYGQEAIAWLRPVQNQNRLTFQFINMPFGYQGPNSSEAWLRVWEPAADTEGGAAQAAAMEKFTTLDLDKVDQLKNELTAPAGVRGGQPGYQGPMIVQAALGKVYIGQLSSRDTRTGQPMQVAFKVVIEKMDGDASDDE